MTLNGDASYPIIADGKVFVATANPGGSYGGWLYALNATTGKVAWGPVPLSARTTGSRWPTGMATSTSTTSTAP